VSAFLLDANVLIALTVAEHEHHDPASSWIAETDEFAVCPVVEGALIRFLLRMGESAATASAVLSGVRMHPRCAFWPDSLSYIDADLTLIHGHRQVTDSYLVSLARDRRARLVTFDTALTQRHPDHCLLLPTA
jgi:toxin-antitoxin system PIN domain toxin